MNSQIRISFAKIYATKRKKEEKQETNLSCNEKAMALVKQSIREKEIPDV